MRAGSMRSYLNVKKLGIFSIFLLVAIELILQLHTNNVYTIDTSIRTHRINSFNKDKSKLILFWEPQSYYDHRYVEICKNKCKSTFDKSLVREADAVVIHGWTLPEVKLPEYRSKNQRWVFYLSESPENTYFHSKEFRPQIYNGLFNWTLTYTRDSDIRIQQYSFEIKSDKLISNKNIYKEKSKFALALISNCKNKGRLDLVKEMQKYSSNKIDFYGKCSKKCTRNRCSNVTFTDYRFYLAFENSFYCKDYITEKFFRNGILSNAVPIVKGARKENYHNLNAPHMSFIYVDDFNSTKELVDYMLRLNSNEQEYNLYHAWRQEYRLKENYIGHWCKLCNKLHEDNEPKVYAKFDEWYNSCENFHA